MSWTDQRVELLRKLWTTDKLSAGQIAGELGGLSRSAVIGKAHRLGLVSRKRLPSALTLAPRVGRRTRSTPFRVAPVLTAQQLQYREAVDLPPDVSRHAVSFLGLSSDTCRWPLRDNDYCGALPLPTSPYCLRHARLSHRPPSEKRSTHV